MYVSRIALRSASNWNVLGSALCYDKKVLLPFLQSLDRATESGAGMLVGAPCTGRYGLALWIFEETVRR